MKHLITLMIMSVLFLLPTSLKAEGEEEQVRSVDGTTISFMRQGSGDPVLLVHGTLGSAAIWAQVAPHLAENFTVVTMDRRGRGASTDGEAYSLELEAADVAAVIDALGKEVHLVGHSFGARVALRAATQSEDVQSLVLYEPPLAPQHLPESLGQRIEDLLRTDNHAAAAELFLSEVAATLEEIEVLKSDPTVWEGFIAAVPTLPREGEELAVSPVDLNAVSHINVPVLLLTGENTTSPLFLDGLDELEQALPDARWLTIQEQQHMAIGFAAEAFAELVDSFLASVD